MAMFYLIFIAFLLVFLYFGLKKSYWDKVAIPGPKPWPLMGNIGAHFLGRKTLGQVFVDIYRKYEGYPVVGTFRARTPCLLIRDPELVHRILVKDFKYFRNNEMYVDKNTESLFNRNPFALRDQEWKDTRQMITPGFTSGRLKNLFPIINSITKDFIRFIQHHPTANTEGIETKLLTKRYTLDNVAKAAFGIDGKSFESYEELSDFMQLANSFLTPGTLHGFFMQLIQIFPALLRIIPPKLISGNIEKKMISIISEVRRYRLQTDAVHKDYLQFLIELGKENKFSDTEVTAHVTTFFFDGYVTSSLVLSYALLCLAQNPKYQARVREEIKILEEKNDGEISYEALQEMELLHACFLESIRLFPVIDMFTKSCTEPYEYTSEDASFKKITIKVNVGDVVIIPYSMFNKDPKYFENPEKFYPERMLGKDVTLNKVFYPFGMGPRACIGQRLATLQIKIGLVHVIKNFEVAVSSKLQQPIKYHTFNIMNEIKGGLWLKYKKINI